jgi:O-antigen/teichoic acid export membrane protein
MISRGLSLASSIVVARVLGREGFGALGIIQTTVGMFGTFAGFELGLTATKYVAEFRGKDPARAGRIMGLSSVVSLTTGGLMTAILVVLAPWLAARTLNAPNLSGLLILSAPLLFFGAWAGAQSGALAGLEAFKVIAKINFMAGLFGLPLMVGGVLLGGLRGAAWGLVGAGLVGCVLNSLALRIEARRAGLLPVFSGCIREWPILWRFSLPALLCGLTVGPINWACNAMLVNQPNGYAEMGVFNAANQWRSAILFLPGTLSVIALPVLSSLHGVKDHLRFKRALLYNALLSGGIALAAALVISVCGASIMRTYGAGFESGRWVLVLLAFSAVLVAVNNVVGQAIASSGRMWVGFLFNSLWASVMLIAGYVLIRRNLALGLALTYVIAYGAHTIWQGVFVAKGVMPDRLP